jgi:hypothetical protein
MEDKPKIIFIIGMHRCGTSLLSNCLVENGFSIGKTKNQDKNWQNPNGYFENDNLTDVHNSMLKYNNSSWNTITKEKMNYTQEHIKLYRRLLETEFSNERLILIKDPRLTFFIDFLKEVCEDKYNYYFLFLTRDKIECCNSLNKAQNICIQKCNILYDITNNKWNNKYLKIDHREIINNNNLVLTNISNFCNINIDNDTGDLVDTKLYRNRNNKELR